MDNQDVDFVAPPKPKQQRPLRHWDFSCCNRAEFESTLQQTHQMLRLACIKKVETEQQFADVCKMDVNSDEWKMLLGQLEKRGHVIVKRFCWAKNSTWQPLPPAERIVKVSGRGEYYGRMTYDQCMTLAMEGRR